MGRQPIRDSSDGARLGRPVTLDQQTRNRIVEARQNGETLSGIARSLNTEGVPTARGGRWHASTIAKVIASVSLDLGAVRTCEGYVPPETVETDMTTDEAIAYIARQRDAGWVPFDHDENNYKGWYDEDEDDDIPDDEDDDEEFDMT